MALKIGYNLFAAASQMGVDTGMTGNIQIVTAKALTYKLRVQRTSDNYYWNNTTKAFVSGATAESVEITVPGSVENRPSAIRHLMMKLPNECVDAITTAGCTILAYAAGDTPSSDGASIVMNFLP